MNDWVCSIQPKLESVCLGHRHKRASQQLGCPTAIPTRRQTTHTAVVAPGGKPQKVGEVGHPGEDDLRGATYYLGLDTYGPYIWIFIIFLICCLASQNQPQVKFHKRYTKEGTMMQMPYQSTMNLIWPGQKNNNM